MLDDILFYGKSYNFWSSEFIPMMKGSSEDSAPNCLPLLGSDDDGEDCRTGAKRRMTPDHSIPARIQ